MSVKGQVDDMLQPETASECQKYGKVLDCVVYEVPGDVPPEESVRIFVRFERVDEALRGKSTVVINGEKRSRRKTKMIGLRWELLSITDEYFFNCA